MTAKFDELVKKLKEIFQIDKPELDFGIYKIMNAKASMIQDFLNNDLKAKVQAALADKAGEGKKALEEKIAKLEAQLDAVHVPHESSPDWVAAKAELDKLAASDDSESLVYAHLLTFFSRYYDDGDFISKRRYKEGQYVVPYSGEEVKLVWVNQDQYYTKSGENFTNYDFKLDDGKKVHFKLVTAAVAKDNVKDNDAVRCFKLWDPANAEVVDDEEEREKLPDDILEEKDGELYIYFQYLKCKKGTKQADLLKDAVEKIATELGAKQLATKFNILAPAPTEKDRSRTVLGKHLQRYVAKNTSDYFIHKDLRKFLTWELDAYVKNEMMNLDDISNAATFDAIAANLRLIQAFRLIAMELICFMAQLEDFQKKLWLKKKFVVQCDYCITMDRVPEELRAEVLANERQQEEWKRLGLPTGTIGTTVTAGTAGTTGTGVVGRGVPTAPHEQGDLFDGRAARPAQPLDARMVDTKFFGEEFKAKLLRSIPDLDEQCDGVLIHAENFQALRFLHGLEDGRIGCVYIDPPYNAKSSEIYYKNTFKHSAWLSFLENRIDEANSLRSQNSGMVIAIDENEQVNLGELLYKKFRTDSTNVSCITIIHNPGGIQGTNFSYTHEFAYFIYPNVRGFISEEKRNDSENPELTPFRDWGKENSKRDESPNCFYPIRVRDDRVVGFGEIPIDEFHPTGANEINGDELLVWPIDINGVERRWRFARETVERIKQELIPVKIRDVWNIQRAKMFYTRKTVWDDPKYCANVSGTQLLSHILKSSFTFPKSLYLVKDCLQSCEQNDSSKILDYFGGSGTTAHAVIALNREDGGKRKYILVEMGEHFDTVLKPRIEKVVYSADWKDGKPVFPNQQNTGISHCFKYMTLESYEDTLNNLKLEKPGELGLLKNEYLLNYMLEVESRKSLLNLDKFAHPFDYTLELAVDSSGATKPQKVDMVETFNYLIGLRVGLIDRHIDKGYVLVQGDLPDGEEALVLWRDLGKVNNEELKKILGKQAIYPREKGFVLYVNGDHNLPNTVTEEGEEKTIKVRSIESDFTRLMFEEE